MVFLLHKTEDIIKKTKDNNPNIRKSGCLLLLTTKNQLRIEAVDVEERLKTTTIEDFFFFLISFFSFYGNNTRNPKPHDKTLQIIK